MGSTREVKVVDTGLVGGTGARHYSFFLCREGEKPVQIWNCDSDDMAENVRGFLRDAFQKVYDAGYKDGMEALNATS